MKKLILIVALAGNLAHIATIQASGAGEKGNVEVKKLLSLEEALEQLQEWYSQIPFGATALKECIISYIKLSKSTIAIELAMGPLDENPDIKKGLREQYNTLLIRLKKLSEDLSQIPIVTSKGLKLSIQTVRNIADNVQPTQYGVDPQIINILSVLDKFEEYVQEDIVRNLPNPSIVPASMSCPASSSSIAQEEDVEMGTKPMDKK